jgi:hypothetical protein
MNISRSGTEVAISVLKVFEVFSPVAYVDAIEGLAFRMYCDSGYREDYEFWFPAEKHVLAVCVGTIAVAENAEKAAAALDNTIKSYNWRDHLQRIRERAWWLWKGREGSFVWDPFQALEDWTEAEQQVRDEISARSVPPKPDEPVT